MNKKRHISAEELSLKYAIPVGEFIKDEMNARSVSQTDFALMLGLERSKLNKIIQGTQSLTADIALKIEAVWGIPAHVYLGLQSQYEIDMARLHDMQVYHKDSFSFVMEDREVYSFQTQPNCEYLLNNPSFRIAA